MIERNIHHTGSPPSRTCLGEPVRLYPKGLWSIQFQRWRGAPGEEVIVSKITSGALFLTAEDAAAAGDRAMDALQSTGMFPNMCEVF